MLGSLVFPVVPGDLPVDLRCKCCAGPLGLPPGPWRYPDGRAHETEVWSWASVGQGAQRGHRRTHLPQVGSVDAARALRVGTAVLDKTGTKLKPADRAQRVTLHFEPSSRPGEVVWRWRCRGRCGQCGPTCRHQPQPVRSVVFNAQIASKAAVDPTRPLRVCI